MYSKMTYWIVLNWFCSLGKVLHQKILIKISIFVFFLLAILFSGKQLCEHKLERLDSMVVFYAFCALVNFIFKMAFITYKKLNTNDKKI